MCTTWLLKWVTAPLLSLTFIFAVFPPFCTFSTFPLHELQPEVHPSLCVLCLLHPHTTQLSLCSLGAFTPHLKFPCSTATLAQPWAESLVPASGWHSACSRGKPSGFRGLSCQLPFPHEAGAGAAAPWLMCRVLQGARGSLWFAFCVWKSQQQPSLKVIKVYLPDFTKAWFDNKNYLF